MGVPGVGQLGGYQEGCIPGTDPRPVLWLIYGILSIDRFILPFDCK